MSKATKKYLVPFCVRTGSVPHYLFDAPATIAQGDCTAVRMCSYEDYLQGAVEWRDAAPFAAPAGVTAEGWRRGRSAANMLLQGPVLELEQVNAAYARKVRTTYYTTQAGLLTLLQGGAFDGPALRTGVLLQPVKRGENYCVEFGGWAPRAATPKLRVALDFDHTLYAGPWVQADVCDGPPMPGAIEWLRNELRLGHEITIHTCRLTPHYEWATWPLDGYREQAAVIVAIRSWLSRHGLSDTEVSAIRFWTHLGKPSCDEYLDDRAIRFEGTYPRR